MISPTLIRYLTHVSVLLCFLLLLLDPRVEHSKCPRILLTELCASQRPQQVKVSTFRFNFLFLSTVSSLIGPC